MSNTDLIRLRDLIRDARSNLMTATNDRSQAYHTGYEARVQGEPKSANPYPAGSWDADEWLAGWNDAE